MSVYANKSLECTESYVKNLCNLILQKNPRCCTCNSNQISTWIIDEALLLSGLVVYIRLFCSEHEKRWKDAEQLDYKLLNGIMLVRLPYQIPVGLWTNVSWKDFSNLLANYFGDRKSVEEKLIPEIVSPCEVFLKKNPKFVLKGTIEDYLKI
ncbi:MAG: hypothetical protein NWF06_03995 [Candidatus Bathyarchaeota archaeon]|nr:hypothetical protein [Candidatus Bathyarchaeum sp.]